MLVTRRGPRDRSVEAAVEDSRDLDVARHDPLVDADVEFRRGGELVGKPANVADAERACRPGGAALRTGGEIENLAGVGQEHPPGRGQFDVSAVANEQLCT